MLTLKTVKVKFGRCCSLGLLWAFAGGVAGVTVDPPGPVDTNCFGGATAQIPYVDFRNGFSVVAPCGSVLLDEAPLIQQGAIERPSWPDPTDWELLKCPPSKQLACFALPDKQKDEYLTVYLLATRAEMTIEQMLRARCDYWEKHGRRASPEKKMATTVNDCRTAHLSIGWPSRQKDDDDGILHEALIQSKKDRYYLLMLAGGANEPNGEPSATVRMEKIMAQFNCLGKEVEDRRWRQGRQRGQELLSSLKIDEIKLVLQGQTWYRVSYEGRDVGFYNSNEQFVSDAESRCVEINCRAFLNQHRAVRSFMRMQGWAEPSSEGSSGAEIPVGPIRIRGRFTLEGSLGGEVFEYHINGSEQPDQGYGQKGVWKAGTLELERGDTKEREKSISETLEVNEKIYLPWVVAELLGRLLKREAGQEYVFIRYTNGALCYHSLRVAAQVELDKSDFQDDGLVTTQTANNDGPRQQGATYMITQMGVHGPIVETWLDEQGRLLKRRAGRLVMQRTSKETIEQLWPREYEKIRDDEGHN